MVGGRGPGRVVSSPIGEKRPQLISPALGVPGTPGTGALLMQQRRGDAGGPGMMVRPDLGSVPVTAAGGRKDESGFIGSITNMFFGRKGGFVS